ncbi:MAG: ABC transporter permease [Balneola sp.]
MSYFLKSVLIALQNIRANPLHTFLSTLGIIIGVAALVGILALGDGLEQTGREQLRNTTSLNILNISSNQTKVVDGIRLSIEEPPKFEFAHAQYLSQEYSEKALIEFVVTETGEISYQDSTMAIYLQGNMEHGLEFAQDSLFAGRYISIEDVSEGRKIAVITYQVADKLTSGEPSDAIGNSFNFKSEDFEIVGILSQKELDFPRVYVPVTTLIEFTDNYPRFSFKVEKAEEIPELEAEIETWLDSTFDEGSEAFGIMSNKARVEQFSKGILLFKLIMGAITGISVLVGGIGVMNVLLISVTERTKEIGIRKATGAKKKDIVLQFMAESVTISFVGCVAGWVIGILGIFTFVPIVNALTDIQFNAALGFGTILVILAIAMLVGVLFGTYPAWRASQLDPIDAIRHE